MRTSALAIATALAAGAAPTPGTAQDAAQDAAAPALSQAGNAWYAAGEEAIAQRLAVQPNTGTARNVILFVADGMGVTTNYAIRLWSGQAAGGLGDDYVLPYEAFPNAALVKTYTTNGQTPDSAPTAAALNTGIKMKNDMINVVDSVAVDDCAAGLDPANQPTRLAEIMEGMGKSVGIVSTTRITHATPAAVFGRTVNRDWENDSEVPEGCEQPDLAAQLADALMSGEIDLALGGGRTQFLPAEVTGEEGEPGLRADGRNLVEEVVAAGGQYAWDEATFGALALPADGPVLGLFEDGHMLYEQDRTGEPSLEEMTRAAIGALDADAEGYYLMVEGGRVDHANHAGNLHRTVTDGAAFAAAVQAAVDLTDPAETLIIVTADHDHGLQFNGYCGRGTPITGLCLDVDPAGVEHTGEPVLADDGKPYTAAGYLNGAGAVLVPEGEVDEDEATPLPAYAGNRPDLTQEEATDPDYLQQALIPLGSETHSGSDVPAFALGPWSHLVSGVMEQNVLFHVMLQAATGGEGMPAAAPAAGAAEGAAAPAGEEGTAVDDTAGDAADAVEELPAEATGEALEEATEGATEGTAAP